MEVSTSPSIVISQVHSFHTPMDFCAASLAHGMHNPCKCSYCFLSFDANPCFALLRSVSSSHPLQNQYNLPEDTLRVPTMLSCFLFLFSTSECAENKCLPLARIINLITATFYLILLLLSGLEALASCLEHDHASTI